MMTKAGARTIAAMMLLAALTGCNSKPAESGTVAQGAAPEGTISDQLPNLDLLPNDAPLADPVDQGLVPAVPGATPPPAEAAPAEPAAPAPTPSAPPVEE